MKNEKYKIEKLGIEDMPIFPMDLSKGGAAGVQIEIENSKTEPIMDVTVPPAEQDMQKTMNIPIFMLSLFQIADQAKIIHLQAETHNEHLQFGLFYDNFTELLDELIESIAGKYGIDKLSFGEANIMLYDSVEAKSKFFEICDNLLRNQSMTLFDKDRDTEICAKIDEMLMLKNKVQYLLQMK